MNMIALPMMQGIKSGGGGGGGGAEPPLVQLSRVLPCLKLPSTLRLTPLTTPAASAPQQQTGDEAMLYLNHYKGWNRSWDGKANSTPTRRLPTTTHRLVPAKAGDRKHRHNHPMLSRSTSPPPLVILVFRILKDGHNPEA